VLELAFQQVVNGLLVGAIYALMALGLMVILGILRIINMAQGELYMLGGYFCYFASVTLGVGYFPAIILAMIAAAGVGVLMDRLAVRPLLIHAVRADAADIAAMVRHRCGVAHCPASNAWLAHGVAPLVEMLQSGLDVGLGSDSMASNTRMDIVGEGRLAARQQHARTRHSAALPPLQLLDLATRGGARAIGLGDVVGVLTPGYQADLAAFAVEAAVSRAQDVAAAVVNTETAVTRRVVVAGQLRVRDGVVLHDDASLAARVHDGAEALARWRHRDPID